MKKMVNRLENHSRLVFLPSDACLLLIFQLVFKFSAFLHREKQPVLLILRWLTLKMYVSVNSMSGSSFAFEAQSEELQ